MVGEWDGLFGSSDIETTQEQIEETMETPETKVSNKNDADEDEKKEKYKLYHSVKLTPEEEEKFQQILAARGTNDSDVIKWCLEKAYLSNEDDIKRIAKKRQRMETL